MKKILAWTGLFIWQILQNLVALAMMPFLGKMTLMYKKRYCWSFYCTNMRGSISLGNFIFLGSKSDTTAGHELGHVVDSHWMGPLYLFIIGIPSILWAAKFKTGNYYKFYTERRANRHSHLHTEDHPLYSYLRWDEGYNLDSIQ